MNWFRLGNPEFLFYILFGLPILFFLLLIGLRKKRKSILLFQNSSKTSDINRQRVQASLLLLVCLLLSFSLTFPKWGAKPETVAERLDVILALDISTSMLATDSNSTRRLTHAKDVIITLLDKLQDVRFGLLYFAEASVVVCPLTNDVNTIKEFLSALKPESLVHRGTRIGNAIDTAKERFIEDSNSIATLNENSGQQVIILFTDGEDHGNNVSNAVVEAKMIGISIFCVGVGSSDKSVPIPLPDESIGYKRDASGQLVLTSLNENLLSEIADEGEGHYYHANIGVSHLLTDLSRIKKKKFKISSDGEYINRFQWFVGFAMFFLLVEIFIQNWRIREDNR